MPREGCLGAEAAAVENSREMERQRMGVLPQGPRECLGNLSLDTGDHGKETQDAGGPDLNPFPNGKASFSLPCLAGQQTSLPVLASKSRSWK